MAAHLRGIAGAVRINLSEGRSALSGHGGSTLTQQTAKLLCLGVPYDPDSGIRPPATVGGELQENGRVFLGDITITPDE